MGKKLEQVEKEKEQVETALAKALADHKAALEKAEREKKQAETDLAKMRADHKAALEKVEKEKEPPKYMPQDDLPQQDGENEELDPHIKEMFKA